MHTYIQTYIHIYIHHEQAIHTYIHTYIHTQILTQIRTLFRTAYLFQTPDFFPLSPYRNLNLNPTLPLFFSVSGFQTAAAEWWLFALADYHVISRHSGFGRSAAMRGTMPGRQGAGAGAGSGSIYTINSPRNNGVGVASCRKDSYTRLDDMATDYSGL